MAFKAMILLKRREDLSQEAFVDWWLGTHRPLALRLPGLQRMVINIGADASAGYDGCSELWFDTEADFHAAYATEIGQAVARDSLSMVSRRDRLFVREIEAGPAPA